MIIRGKEEKMTNEFSNISNSIDCQSFKRRFDRSLLHNVFEYSKFIDNEYRGIYYDKIGPFSLEGLIFFKDNFKRDFYLKILNPENFGDKPHDSIIELDNISFGYTLPDFLDDSKINFKIIDQNEYGTNIFCQNFLKKDKNSLDHINVYIDLEDVGKYNIILLEVLYNIFDAFSEREGAAQSMYDILYSMDTPNMIDYQENMINGVVNFLSTNCNCNNGNLYYDQIIEEDLSALDIDFIKRNKLVTILQNLRIWENLRILEGFWFAIGNPATILSFGPKILESINFCQGVKLDDVTTAINKISYKLTILEHAIIETVARIISEKYR